MTILRHLKHDLVCVFVKRYSVSNCCQSKLLLRAYWWVVHIGASLIISWLDHLILWKFPFQHKWITVWHVYLLQIFCCLTLSMSDALCLICLGNGWQVFCEFDISVHPPSSLSRFSQKTSLWSEVDLHSSTGVRALVPVHTINTILQRKSPKS